jgi:pimeloyl-ACP methyl ester carboxylesterase
MGFPPPEPTVDTEALWQETQRDLANLMPGAELVVAENNGHDVIFAQPGVGVDAVRRVVGET